MCTIHYINFKKNLQNIYKGWILAHDQVYTYYILSYLYTHHKKICILNIIRYSFIICLMKVINYRYLYLEHKYCSHRDTLQYIYIVHLK